MNRSDEKGDDDAYSLTSFQRAKGHHDHSGGSFYLENPRLLAIDLDGLAWTKMGTMVSYTGTISFTREGLGDHGFGKWLKRGVAKEGIYLNKAEGKGTLYLGNFGQNVQILNLKEDESFYVNGHNILAFEKTVKWDITLMKKLAGVMEGGLFVVKFKGPGAVAITTAFDPLVLNVSSDQVVHSSPHTTVAWSGNLAPSVHLDVSWKTFVGRGSGESVQMEFKGDSGFVVLQPVHFFGHF